MKLQKNRQSSFALLFLLLIFEVTNLSAQPQKTPIIDYSVKSNILNPDTLRGDQKKIFWHFVKLTHKQAEELEPLKVKAEFEKIGITTKERARFVAAYTFLDTHIVFHKKSCEQWESFKDLAPGYKK